METWIEVENTTEKHTKLNFSHWDKEGKPFLVPKTKHGKKIRRSKRLDKIFVHKKWNKKFNTIFSDIVIFAHNSTAIPPQYVA
jgi:hypothetical protein